MQSEKSSWNLINKTVWQKSTDDKLSDILNTERLNANQWDNRRI